jgi:hypothetical protein
MDMDEPVGDWLVRRPELKITGLVAAGASPAPADAPAIPPSTPAAEATAAAAAAAATARGAPERSQTLVGQGGEGAAPAETAAKVSMAEEVASPQPTAPLVAPADEASTPSSSTAVVVTPPPSGASSAAEELPAVVPGEASAYPSPPRSPSPSPHSRRRPRPLGLLTILVALLGLIIGLRLDMRVLPVCSAPRLVPSNIFHTSRAVHLRMRLVDAVRSSSDTPDHLSVHADPRVLAISASLTEVVETQLVYLKAAALSCPPRSPLEGHIEHLGALVPAMVAAPGPH